MASSLERTKQPSGKSLGTAFDNQPFMNLVILIYLWDILSSPTQNPKPEGTLWAGRTTRELLMIVLSLVTVK